MKPEIKNLIVYIVKCVTGCVVVFILSGMLNYPDISWCIISVMLVLTPENTEALPLAITRIKANLIAGSASLLCLFFLPATPVTIILVIIITIVVCYLFNLMAGSRAAIAAVIIIMLHGMEYNQVKFWTVTFQRIIAVVAGCLIGLLITLIFHRNIIKKNFQETKSVEG